MNLKDNPPALILVNFQKGFLENTYWGNTYSTPNILLNSKKILEMWRHLGLSLIHVQHQSQDINSPLFSNKISSDFIDDFKPKEVEKVIKKSTQSIFFGNDLQDYLIKNNINKLVFIGFRTEVSISSSIRMAKDMMFDPYLVADATCTFDKISYDGIKYPADILHQTELVSLRKEFARIITTSQIELFYNHLTQNSGEN